MQCIFEEILPSCSQAKKFEKNILSQMRKEKVISCSHERKDNFHTQIEQTFSDMKIHTDCYINYTSKDKIARLLKKMKPCEKDSTPPTKRLRRLFYSHNKNNLKKNFSTKISFAFDKDCLFCGENAEILVDERHPERSNRNQIVMCMTADRTNQLSFKDSLLQVDLYFMFNIYMFVVGL